MRVGELLPKNKKIAQKMIKLEYKEGVFKMKCVKSVKKYPL